MDYYAVNPNRGLARPYASDVFPKGKVIARVTFKRNREGVVALLKASQNPWPKLRGSGCRSIRMEVNAQGNVVWELRREY